MKSRLKKLLGALPLLLLGMLGGFVIGYVGAQLMLEESSSPIMLVILLVWLYAAMLLQIIIHEAGHLLFGLASSYRFCSFRIGSLMLSRVDGRLKLSRMSIAGTCGQCLLAPPEPDENGSFPTALYNLGGSLLNLISAVILAALAFSFRDIVLAFVMLAMLALVGLAFAIMNGIPFRSGLVVNDGFNQRVLSQKPSAKSAFAIQLKIAERLSLGDGIVDMPSQWFELPSDISDPLSGTIAVFRTNRLLAEEKFTETAELIERLTAVESGILPLHLILMKLDLISLELIGENRRERLDALLTQELRGQMKSLGTNISAVRCEYLIAKLYNGDIKKAAALKSKFEKLAKVSPYPKELEIERKLIALADNKV